MVVVLLQNIQPYMCNTSNVNLSEFNSNMVYELISNYIKDLNLSNTFILDAISAEEIRFIFNLKN